MKTASQAQALESPVRAPGARIVSLDVFRGSTIASMILVNNPGSWSNVYAPLLHAEWHGWTFTDTVFPFFLWIVGVAITFSFARRVAEGADRGRLLAHVAKRSALIFAVGLFLNAFPRFDLSTLRIPGVLQRIAVCYLIAATLYLFTKTRGRIVWTVGLMALYWWLMMGLGGGVLEPVGNFAQKVDAAVMSGHMYSETKVWDPEGIVSTLPSIATVLLGIMAGQLLRSRLTPEQKTSWMFFGGVLVLFAGLMLSTWMPINKKLWTPPFTLFMGGLAAVVLACWYWVVDVQGWKRWTRPFAIYGMNAITVYVLSGVIADLLGLLGWWRPAYGFFAAFAPPKFASLLFAVTFVLALYAVAWFMYRRQWFVRL